MHKKILLCLSVLSFLFRAFAAQEPMPMEIDEPARQNPFDLISDDVIRHIADLADQKSCGRMRQICKRFNDLAWQYDKPCEIVLTKGAHEWQLQYWERVYAMVAVAKVQSGRHKANNKIILFPQITGRPENKLYLPELANADVDGLRVRPDSMEQSEFIKMPEIFPNLTFLDLIVSKYDRQKLRLPTLDKLTKLQTLHVKRHGILLDYIECVPASLSSLSLDDHCLLLGRLDFRKIAYLNCLRWLSLKNMVLWPIMLEDLALYAPNLEKLHISSIRGSFEFEKLLCCLASFEKLQELDISMNDLSPKSLACLTQLPNLKRINLTGNEQCEAQKDLVRSMFPPTVTISYEATFGAVGFSH